MGGGLMQLVAYGAQDVYLTGNPQITFFKVVYRRHTNFSVESIEQTLNGTVASGNSVSCNLSRNGDLVNGLLLEVTCTSGADNRGDAWSNAVADCSVEIGGQQIDKQYAEWMNVWTELTTTAEQKAMLDTMLDVAAGGVYYVPLQFWFCRDNGLALPLIALQYHEVRVKITLGTDVASAKLYADYVYLDTDERRRFAQSSHEYLIEQVQRSQETSSGAALNKYRLNFNHPVKELVWTTGAAITDARLVLNGHERMSSRSGAYFNTVQVFQHHTGNPAEVEGSRSVNVYSFALNPEKHQPSGTCNFSRIDNATLEVTEAGATATNIYAHNYNVLRVMSGMGGLAYSN